MVDGKTFPDVYAQLTTAQKNVVDLYMSDTKGNMTIDLLESGRVCMSIDPDYLSKYHHNKVSMT